MMYRRLMFASIALSLAACAEMEADKDTDTDTDMMADTDDTMDTDTTTEPASIVDTVVNTDRFSHLEAAVIRAGLTGALTGGITVFAPNDTAFEALFTALGVDGVDDLSVDQLTAVLTYHVLASEVDSAAAISVAGGAGTTAALGGSLDLSYDGSVLSVDGADVITADIEASDGIIHEIDAVLVPSITDVVTTDAELTVLTQAVLAADGDASDPMLVSTLDGAGTFTLFAPTDAAFTALLTDNGLADLNAAVTALGGTDDLVGLLQYHVLGTTVDAAAAIAADGMSVNALAGGGITVDVIGGMVVLNSGVDGGLMSVNDATVVTADILTSNGVIHKIDQVIKPGVILMER